MKGITRLDYARTTHGWWIRLAYRHNRPMFSAVVRDSDHNYDPAKSFTRAKQVRDAAWADLSVRFPRSQRIPIIPRNNRSGVVGVRLNKVIRRSGTGHYWRWQVSWSQDRESKARSFGFTTYGGEFEAFKAAVMFRWEKEWELYNMSLIDPERMEEYFAMAFDIYGNGR
jgi:hypothetical protein